MNGTSAGGGAWADAWRALPEFLAPHVVLSAVALVLALAISAAAAAVALRRPRIGAGLLAAASVIQTAPALALMALFYPLLLAVSSASEALGGPRTPALGFTPAVMALTLYALLPLLRGILTGLRGVDPSLVEAARAAGMTRRQRLLRVELPLAAPVIMAGLRTAAVWTIGAATLATPVGQTSLGNYIFTGLQTQNWVSVLVGVIASAGLALVVDALLALAERGARTRRLPLVVASLAGLALGVAAAAAPAFAPGGAAYRIGAKNFSEQFILAEAIAQKLGEAGARARVVEGLGSAVAFRALAANDIDVAVDYAGTLWLSTLGRTDAPPRAEMTKALTQELRARHGVVVLGALGFENAYALAMRANRARELGVRTLDDLARVAGALRFGADLEFLDRPEWARLREAYGLSFAQTRAYTPTFMYRALESGEADVISAFSSDGRLSSDAYVALEDPRGAVPNYDALLLLAPGRADDARLRGALAPLVGAIGVDAMRRANDSVDRETDKASPAAAARSLLEGLAPR